MTPNTTSEQHYPLNSAFLSLNIDRRESLLEALSNALAEILRVDPLPSTNAHGLIAQVGVSKR